MKRHKAGGKAGKVRRPGALKASRRREASVQLRRERDEALAREAATSEVLHVISSSPAELKLVFKALLENATRICEATFGHLLLREGSIFRAVAIHSREGHVDLRRNPILDVRDNPGTPIERLNHTKQVVHIPDLRNHQSYIQRNQRIVPLVETGGARTFAIVPMLKGDELIGGISMYRQEVRPFTDKQIELVQNFAAQAVIAIENTRLLNELRQRTDDLSEALEQQTATSEVLSVISSSAGELQPVFQTMLAKAAELCEASFGALWLVDGEGYRTAALHGDLPEAYVEQWRSGTLHRPKAAVPMVRAIRSRKPVHIADMRKEKAYLEGDPLAVSVADVAGIRTLLTVPMLKGREAVGVITIYRKEVRVFSDKQVELISNFAKQAVIAIENTRLLSELRESLQQQTATADVLKVISSSPGALDPVFSTMLAKATELCDASYGTLWLHEGDGYRAVAMHGDLPPVWFEQWRSGAIYHPGPDRPMARAAEGREPIQIADMRTDPSYLQGDALPVTGVEIAGIRTLLLVPMFRESENVGLIAIYRKEVLPFTEKQIDLVKNFAAQAVIAIENARLLNELRQRTDDLSESLEQQTATSEVLKVISSSPGELKPVFDALLANAVRICGANFGNLYLREGDAFRIGATYGAPPAYVEYLRTEQSFPLNPKIGLGLLVRTKETYHLADISAVPTHGEKLREATITLAGARTLVGLPMLKDNEVIGAIVIYRQEVRPFTEKQIELVKNFATQAVIAIENTRLLNELRQRTDDLSESLEQQTATSEVLKAISSSPGELEPVFQAMLGNAVRICEANFGMLFRVENGAVSAAAMFGVPPAFAEFWQRGPQRPGRRTALGRVVETRQTVHIADIKLEPAYVEGEPVFLSAVSLGGFRTLIAVPMLKDNELVGAIGIYRQEVLPFTDKQIELVKNFAAQAVIAIENTRLLNELRESLQQQTATADVLKVISRSTFDLQSVLQTLVEFSCSALRCRESHNYSQTRR